MRRKKSYMKRSLACCLTVMLVVTMFSGIAWSVENTAVSLEQAIRIVKENFEVPAEFTKFTSGYNTTMDNRSAWTLNWNAEGEPGGNLNAQVDSSTGEILNVNIWKPDIRPNPSPQKPVVSALEAQGIATDMMRRLASTHASELHLMPDDNQLAPINPSGPLYYTFRWQRMANGVPYPDNGVTIGVNGEDGKVISYNLNWSLTALPSADRAISPEKALQVFNNAGMLELQYFMPPRYVPLAASSKDKKVMLVYQLSHPSGGVIDALTGQPVNPEVRWMGGGGDGGAEYSRKAIAVPAPNTPLSPEEQAEIEKNSKVISKEQALAVVKQWVPIPSGATLRSSQLEADWMFPEQRSWNFNWGSDRLGDGKAFNLSAQVNAMTGELIGFDIYSDYAQTGQENAVNREAAKKLAEDFLKKIQPERMQQSRFNDRYNPGWAPVVENGKNPPMQTFNYQRLVNQVPFSSNGLTVTVDAVNKTVTSYRCTWYPLDFPSPSGVLPDATGTFLQRQPLALVYNESYKADGQREIKLVYRPQPPAGQTYSQMMDARTGEFLDYQGQPLSKQPRSRTYTDIAGSFAEKDIQFLGQAGLFSEYGDQFHPDENISVASFLRAMLMIKNGVWISPEPSDQDILKRARQMGWLKEDIAATDTVSRELAAKLVIRMLDLDRAARVQGIYKTPYLDADQIPAESEGYVALAWGLNIMKGNNSRFDPDQVLTRAQAAVILVRSLEVKP
ncbi:MAG: peptidase M4 [Firmicutes bacterium]|nr:peptidase M4 [Bacillota bacterium]